MQQESLSSCFGVDQKVVNKITGAVFAYLFHRINQRDLINWFDNKNLSDKVISSLRKNGYILRNCKAYGWAYYKFRIKEDIKPKYKDYGIHSDDKKILSRLNLKHLSLKYESWNVSEMTEITEGILLSPEMKVYIGKYISKCLTFLIRSYGIKRHDIETEMQLWALRAIYMTYPRFESRLHVVNIAKAAIHNCGQSQIQYHTSPARQRLQLGANGMQESNHVPYDLISNTVAVEPSKILDIKEKMSSLVSFAERCNMREDVKRFLVCCAGGYDEGFSEFLSTKNDNLVDEISYQRYMRKAQTYFKFSETQVQNLFSKLKAELA